MLENWNEQTMAKMVKEELPRIYNLCYRLCQNKEEAEDLAQDTFLKAIRAIPKFKGESSVSTWLYRIAVNTWKNRVRHQTRRFFKVHISLSSSAEESWDGEPKEIELKDPSPSPPEELERIEGEALMIKTLDNLGDEEKAIIILKDVDQKSYEEIAEVMNINLGTVKSRLSRAREKFREVYKYWRVRKR
ncbi:MAG: sigma-70 family RNA polymerase sigma factor [Elusimicrobia bacterium]|nr:sigma-70 family RNA polymerase sigma factor [Candidatus Obscuribacterium magneticum]